MSESLEISRYVLKNSTTGEVVVKHLNKAEENDKSSFWDSANSRELDIQDKMLLVEWFTEEYKGFGCTLQVVSNKSEEGSNFCRGFGRIGGILCSRLDMRSFDEFSDDEEVYDDGEDYDDAKYESMNPSLVLVLDAGDADAAVAPECCSKKMPALIKDVTLFEIWSTKKWSAKTGSCCCSSCCCSQGAFR